MLSIRLPTDFPENSESERSSFEFYKYQKTEFQKLLHNSTLSKTRLFILNRTKIS